MTNIIQGYRTSREKTRGLKREENQARSSWQLPERRWDQQHAVGSGTQDLYHVARLNSHWVPDIWDIMYVLRNVCGLVRRGTYLCWRSSDELRCESVQLRHSSRCLSAIVYELRAINVVSSTKPWQSLESLLQIIRRHSPRIQTSSWEPWVVLPGKRFQCEMCNRSHTRYRLRKAHRCYGT